MLPLGVALADGRSQPRRESLMDRLDWAILTLMIVLIPALLAAMGFESRKSTSQDQKD